MKMPQRLTASIAIALCALMPTLGEAATYRVTRFDDPKPDGCLRTDCSLREAVIAANATTVADVITLQSGTYVLTQVRDGADTELSRDLDVSRDLQIVGQGPDSTIVRYGIAGSDPEGRVISVINAQLTLTGLGLRDGNLHSSHLMAYVYGGCLRASGAFLVLDHVSLRNCKADGLAAFGGAASISTSKVQLTDVVLDENIGAVGGALMLQSSTVHSTRLRIALNTARVGGAVFAGGAVSLTGSAVELIGNSASVSGGGIHLGSDAGGTTLKLQWAAGSRIAQNTARFGGAINVSLNSRLELVPAGDGTSGPTDLLRIEDNQASAAGGAIHASEYQVGTVRGGTLVAHRIALRRNLTDGRGGGVYSAGETTLVDSEIVDNVALLDGGGISFAGEAPARFIERTSVARNQSGAEGGGIAIDAPAVQLLNVSLHANTAAGGGGAIAVATGRRVDLTHVSSAFDGAARGGSLAVAPGGTANILNSVLAAGCDQDAGSLFVDLGGNAQQLAQTSCVGAAFSAAQLALQPGYFGGRFDVLGTGSASALRNAAPAMASVPLDVRGFARGTTRDIGAFDHAATAPAGGP